MTSTLKIAAADHPIKSVTIFKSSKAEIVRTFVLQLEAGQNKVHITGLSGVIDTDSVRVSGLGQARLFDVVCTLGSTKGSSGGKDGESETIRLLKKKKADVEARKGMYEQEMEILSSYGKTLDGEHVKPTDVSQFLADFGNRWGRNLETVSTLREQIVEIDHQIWKETSKAAMKKGRATGEVSVVIGTDEKGSVELKLTYIVANASWEPTYELHASTENGKPSSAVSLQYRARVKQSTGEDWTDTALTLSTVASDTVTQSIPYLKPMKIRPQPANTGKMAAYIQQQMQQQQAPTQQSWYPTPQQRAIPPPTQIVPPEALREDFGEEDGEFDAVDVPGPFLEPATVVSESPLAISYAVEGKSAVPSDGVAHQVSIAKLPFEAKITHIAIPRIQPNVYLQCQVKNTSEYRLLPGLVTVILDGSYVSKSSISDINIGDTFHCTLGTDSAIKVTYSRTSRTTKSAAGSFAEVMKTTTYTTKITIHNKHAFAIADLVVREVVPMSDDKQVKVILRKPEGLADAKDGDIVRDAKRDGLKVNWEKLVDGKGGEKEGKFEWTWQVDSGAQIKLEAEWEVKAPADINWTEVY